MDAPHSRPDAPAVSNARAPRLWLRVLVVCAALLAMFAGSAFATCGYQMVMRAEEPAKPSTQTVVRGTSTIVSAIRDLAVLQASAYQVERVIDLKDKQAHVFGLIESEDAILLVASGEVIAGVDLSTMQEGDISVDPESKVAYLTIPPSTILSARLDNERTYVHTRKTDALALRAETLETRARQEAEVTLRESAVSGGILQRADKNAARTLETLVRALGFTRVVVRQRQDKQ